MKGETLTAAGGDYLNGTQTLHIANVQAADFSFTDFEAFLAGLTEKAAPEAGERSDFPVDLFPGYLYTFFAKVGFSSFSIDGMTGSLDHDGAVLDYKTGQGTLLSMRDGVLEAYMLRSMELGLGGNDSGIKMTIGNMVLNDYHVRSVIHASDPSAYEDGKGDGVWMPFSGVSFITDIHFSVSGDEMKIGAFKTGSARIRQFDRSPVEIARSVRELGEGKAEGLSWAQSMKMFLPALSAYYKVMEYDRIEVRDIETVSGDTPPVLIGSMWIDGYSVEKGIGEVGIENLEIGGASPDRGGIALGKFAIGDIRFPDLASVMAHLDTIIAEGGEDPQVDYRSIAALSPILGNLSLERLHIEQADGGAFGIGGITVALEDYINLIPTRVKIDLKDVDLFLGALAPSNRTAEFLTALGYEKAVLNGTVNAEWDEASGDLRILPSRVMAGDLGEATLSATFSGVPRAMIKDPQKASLYVAGLLFKEAHIAFQDASFVNRLIVYMANEGSTGRDTVKAHYVTLTGIALSVLQNPEFSRKAQTAVREFLAEPGYIALSAKPEAPVPLIGVGLMMQQAPDKLVETLKLDIATK